MSVDAVIYSSLDWIAKNDWPASEFTKSIVNVDWHYDNVHKLTWNNASILVYGSIENGYTAEAHFSNYARRITAYYPFDGIQDIYSYKTSCKLIDQIDDAVDTCC